MPDLSFSPTKVLSTTEARTSLPGLAADFRERGIEAGIVFFGPQRHPDGAIVPAQLLEALAPFLEDLVIVEGVRLRRAADDGQRTTLDKMIAERGIDAADIVTAANDLAAELGV